MPPRRRDVVGPILLQGLDQLGAQLLRGFDDRQAIRAQRQQQQELTRRRRLAETEAKATAAAEEERRRRKDITDSLDDTVAEARRRERRLQGGAGALPAPIPGSRFTDSGLFDFFLPEEQVAEMRAAVDEAAPSGPASIADILAPDTLGRADFVTRLLARRPDADPEAVLNEILRQQAGAPPADAITPPQELPVPQQNTPPAQSRTNITQIPPGSELERTASVDNAFGGVRFAPTAVEDEPVMTPVDPAILSLLGERDQGRRSRMIDTRGGAPSVRLPPQSVRLLPPDPVEDELPRQDIAGLEAALAFAEGGERRNDFLTQIADALQRGEPVLLSQDARRTLGLDDTAAGELTADEALALGFRPSGFQVESLRPLPSAGPDAASIQQLRELQGR